ncbi:MAG: serine/threonine protein kinase [Gammaproteobacteria bacterium]|nr:serine/threonine protein kinase [Gammaproteobacteria bacterium]
MTEKKAPLLGRFELRSELGRGFHGRVFLAWDPRLERKVAIKLLLGSRRDGASRAQFLNEARAVARVAHPHVIPLYEVGLHGSNPFLVFEFVEGVTLKQEIQRRGALPEDEAIPLFLPVLEGMSIAHELEVVHLDLSPNNLLFDTLARVRVMDFGLARLVSRLPAADDDEHMQGTPRYMSPEHFTGGVLDRRTDVYALGLVFFEMLAGQPAASAEGLTGVRNMILKGDFDWSRLQALGVSGPVTQVLRDALARLPSTRFAHAGEFRRALAEAVATQTQPDSHDLAVQFLLRRLQRRPEFPAFSNSILEINRLTADDSSAGLNDLAEVVQRDFSLANRLMKISNSAFFDRGGDGVSTISQAISLVGTRLVRMLCNGLLVFDRLQNDTAELQDGLVSSFVAGLMARNLGLRLQRALAEEAFICGLFNRLGRNLVIYYLPEEFSDIGRLCLNGVSFEQAQKRVLGSTCAAIGAAIAATWKFPPAIVASMAPILAEPEAATIDAGMTLRLWAQLANELCEVANVACDAPLDELDLLALRYRNAVSLSPQTLGDLLAGALETFLELAPTLGITASANGFCQRASQFLAVLRVTDAAQPAEYPT